MITSTLADAITGVLTDAANGLEAFIKVLQNAQKPIPVALQTLTIKVKFQWTFQQMENLSASGGINIWVFN